MCKLSLVLITVNVLWIAACGGSSGGGINAGGSDPSTINSVLSTCSPSTIQSRQTSQCSATVMGTGSFSSAVTWSASAGGISSGGQFTAPVVASTTSVTITVTSEQDSTKFGTTTITVNPPQTTNNVQPIIVDPGPAPQSFFAVDELFTTVTVCIPNTTTCQSIDHVLVDTGSSGLRLLSTASGGELTLVLPNQSDSSGNPLLECEVFLDGYIWGNVARADIVMVGEKAPAASVHVIIPPSSSPPVPGSCSGQNMGPNEGSSLSALGANGILGVGLFQQDCGVACTSQNQQISPVYYGCAGSSCVPTYVTSAEQISNPTMFFATDNNGVLIQLPAVPNGGSDTANGSLFFGIGTQSNNALGSATVYTVPASGSNAGDITTTFNGTSYPMSFIDSGSNGIFFSDSTTTGIPLCAKPNDSWYCPNPMPDDLSATTKGSNGNQGTVNFALENATTLFSGNHAAFSTLGGPNSGAFDWGLPFFFGRRVFIAVENMNTPGGLGPYIAY